MSVAHPPFASHRRPRLLQGASVAALAAGLAGPASAQLQALHGAAHVGATAGTPAVAVTAVPGLSTSNPAMANAAARSLANAGRAQQAVNLAQQVQAAARQAAAALPGGGAGGVPNGLIAGGLVPVANPFSAANDPTGLSTWQGANAPTQAAGAGGAVTVDVKQTQSRAILDWQSFNVGANTTLSFDQSQDGVGQPGWVALNRVVGGVNSATGLRDGSGSPSRILGSIKAQGTVLIINQNGILFSPTAQVNTNSLIATSLEIGAQIASGVANNPPTTLAQRDAGFLNNGLVGATTGGLSGQLVAVADPLAPGAFTIEPDPLLEGAVQVQAGAQISSGAGGYVVLAAPQVTNAGTLSSHQGQVSLAAGRTASLTPSSGSTATGGDPNVRGLLVTGDQGVTDATTASEYAINAAGGLILTPEGYASISAPTVINAGVIGSTTTVARNGYISLNGQTVQLDPTSVLSIAPDTAVVIPQDAESLANFKPSRIDLGLSGLTTSLESGSLIYAPGATVNTGATPGVAGGGADGSRVFVDSGAVIDVSGVKNVELPASTNTITISPVTRNDTADTPTQRTLFGHASVTVDPRLSGVRSDGVVWVGSPLIPAQAFAQQVGVSAAQLLTKGGNVVLGAAGAIGGATDGQAADVIVKPGAVIDVSGGWRSFAPGRVQTTKLISASGAIVDIGDASPDQVFTGIYNGPTAVQPRFGISQSFANPLLVGSRQDPGYIEGADAGSLTIKASAAALEGTVYGEAYTGPLQALQAQVGTGTPTLYGDQRNVQAVRSELPTGAFLFIQETGNGTLNGGDIVINDEETRRDTAALSSGQPVSIDGSGQLAAAPTTRLTEAQLSVADQRSFHLSAPALNRMGLGQLSLYTSGALTVAAGADLRLAPGGVFNALTGRTIDIEGSVTAPSGRISLQTVSNGVSGSIFNPTPRAPGVFDIVVDGQLSAAGLWANDYGASRDTLAGSAYTGGGSISLTVAPRENLEGFSLGAGLGDVATSDTTADGSQPTSTTDISGSIRVAGSRSLLDVSAGGYVAPSGALSLNAKGGAVTLSDATVYFPLALFVQDGTDIKTGTGFVTGFRIADGINGAIPINPNALTSVVALRSDAVRGYGFGGGGRFTLTTPAFAFGDGLAARGTRLPLDFFSKAGFSSYTVTSYGTQITPNGFDDGLGGYNAVLATQIVGVGAGQTLNLTQSGYSPFLTGDQTLALRSLPTSGSVTSVLTPGVRTDVYDQRPVSLSLAGLMELKVAQGGVITGAPGAALSVAQLDNAGMIRLPGGALKQTEILPSLYGGRDVKANVNGNPTLSLAQVYTGATLADIFSTGAGGAIDPDAPSAANPSLTNDQLAATSPVYLLGDLPAGVGLHNATGATIDLSGEEVVNPNIRAFTQGRQVVSGAVTAGGVLQSADNSYVAASTPIFSLSSFSTNPAYATQSVGARAYGVSVGQAVVSDPDSRIDLSGANAVFDQLTAAGSYVQAPQWSDGGSLLIGASATLTGATIAAEGGATEAAGGVLSTPSLTLTANDPTAPTADVISAAQIEGAGFGTLVVNGMLSSQGDPVRLSLDQGFFLYGPAANSLPARLSQSVAPLSPKVSTLGVLEIDAPYINLTSAYQAFGAPLTAGAGTGRVTLSGQVVDVTGAVQFDGAVGQVTLTATDDLRLTGTTPSSFSAGAVLTPSLKGQLAVTGDLTLKAAQVYATTGSSFSVVSAGADSTITVASAGGATRATPYSAGSDLSIQAANIVQAGVLRAPLGALTLGSNTATAFAPATKTLTLAAGSVTSVSADGLSIPYGTTTDQQEYFFTPLGGAALTAPPAAVLSLAGASVTTQASATVDIEGGGDLFAYEFVPGTGGSRDVLSRFNPDAFTSNNGFQYADGRQVYALVPELSASAVAAYDPISSADYAALYAPGGAGLRVVLGAGAGVAAGTYTLLPARYAVLPGALEVVQDTSATTVPVGASVTHLDGSVSVTGYFAGLGGTQQSTPHVFDVKNRAVIDTYSQIALTSATTTFTALATKAAQTTPRLPADAGRLVVNPTGSLDLSGVFQTAAAAGGRGGEVDVSAAAIRIVSEAGPAIDGVVQLSAGQLTGLNASSLLIGGVRADGADGTTALRVGAGAITLANDAAHPLTAPTIVLAVNGSASALTIEDGAALVASGADTSGQTGALLIDGKTGQTAQGALVRVSTAGQRLVTRLNATTDVPSGGLTVGAATLQGASLLLDSGGAFSLSPGAGLKAADIALDAPAIGFTQGSTSGGGLVLTPALQASLSRATRLTLRSPAALSFERGDYGFGDLALDAPGVAVVSGPVRITAKAVQVADTFADLGACGAGGAPACGTGSLSLAADSLVFGDGTVRVFGADGAVAISTTQGIAYQGRGALDVGSAPLTLTTPFVRDRLAPQTQLTTAVEIPSLALSTVGALSIAWRGAAVADDAAGVPGSSLSLSADAVSVTGADLRATAGSLTAASASGLAVGAGATLRAPGYARSFGDATDPYSISAPGGLLTLTAADGDITLAPGSTLSVGGGTGNGGGLAILAGRGAVAFGGTIDGAAPGGGASFALNEAGAFDLAGFLTATKGAFAGEFRVETGAGDLAIAAGQTLKATEVALVADGGAVRLDGTIDTSGVDGGDVGMFGATGVTLGGQSRIATRAAGYGATDTRQARAGNVTLGVAGAGAISVAQGAALDLGVDHGAGRVVEGRANSADASQPSSIVTTYAYVPADLGGVLTLRAPVLGDGPVGAVNVAFAGAATGARSVVLEGYKAFDLDAVAAGGQFSGVTIAGGLATLDTTATGLPNFLADASSGTLPDFIQRFDVSQSYGGLGGLVSLPTFHARPGVELDYAGDITLASNWNLGAGVVDVPGAVAAGLMVPDAGVAGAYSVVPGAEGAIFSNFTRLTYRVGGGVRGEPGALAIKAGGQLTVAGSLTDGFFSFGDQTDPTFLGTFGGRVLQPAFSLTTTSVSFDQTTLNINSTANPNAPVATIPYRDAANSPGALGQGTNGAGDPLGGAELFPLVQDSGGAHTVDSWSYALTGGAASGANPSGVRAGAAGGVSVRGFKTYTAQSRSAFAGDLQYKVSGVQGGQSAQDAVNALLARNPSLRPTSPVTLNFATAPAAAVAALSALATNYFGSRPGSATFVGSPGAYTSVRTTIQYEAGFLAQVAAAWPSLQGLYAVPVSAGVAQTVMASTLVRTGTGAIDIAAAGSIDLRNGEAATYLSRTSGAVTTADLGYQLGGAPVYTAGARIEPGAVTGIDATTGEAVTLDPAEFATTGTNVGVFGYGYGLSTPSGGARGLAGVQVADAVYADGGGDVTLDAGGDVLSRRDAYLQARLPKAADNTLSNVDFVGRYDQPWRVGRNGRLGGADATALSVTDIRVNPLLFSEGVGALGGGAVAVRAGGRIADLSVVSDTSVTTGAASGAVTSGQVSQGLITYGGGNVMVAARSDVLGGRLDVASGAATVSAGGGVVSAGSVTLGDTGPASTPDTIDNLMRVRLTDATVALASQRDIALQGIAALGVRGDATGAGTSNGYAFDFYSAQSGVSLLADGNVSLANATTGDVLALGAEYGATSNPRVPLPASFGAVALTGDLTLNANRTNGGTATSLPLLLHPSATGTLSLAAGGDIAPTTVAMLDDAPGSVGDLPIVLPYFTQAQLQAQHDPSLPHRDDPTPNRIYAGRDVSDLTLFTPKQTRIGAGRDIVNMVFFGQNLSASDVTRVVAGRDITATSTLIASSPTAAGLPAVEGNTFILGGPGALILEAGRDLGPFLNSAVLTSSTGLPASFAGGVLTVGNIDNPFLPQVSASLDVEFGVSKGYDYASLIAYYLDPANQAAAPDYLFKETLDANNVYVADRTQPIYAPKLIAFMQSAHAPDLVGRFGTTQVSYDQAYAAFTALPALQQRPFLQQVYFNELSLTSVPGPTLNQYSRGYTAVNLLFPASLGYTANNLGGGSNGANARVQTGDLDLRLATLETQYGGNLTILGPGGRVLAGSTVATAQQAARRNSEAGALYAGRPVVASSGFVVSGALANTNVYQAINNIPAGFEGVLTLRGGAISSFTDGDLVLNQSRLFTEQGGNITLWSSNGDLNAGEGPKTSSNFPPVAVRIDQNGYAQLDQATGVTGAGIAAFQAAPGVAAPDVFLIAPRGTVDAGAAGVRVAGNLFVAAARVANADNFQVGGSAIGLPPASSVVNVSAGASAASNAAVQQAADAVRRATASPAERSIITVDILGFGDPSSTDGQ